MPLQFERPGTPVMVGLIIGAAIAGLYNIQQVNAFHDAVDQNPEFRNTEDYQFQRLQHRTIGMLRLRLSSLFCGLLGYLLQISMPLLRNNRPSVIGFFVGAVLATIQGLHSYLSEQMTNSNATNDGTLTHDENANNQMSEDYGPTSINIIMACALLGYVIEHFAEQRANPAGPAPQ